MVDELGSREEIEYIQHDPGERAAARTASLRVFDETGDLKKVVDYMIEETEAGLPRGDRFRQEQDNGYSQHAHRDIPFDPELTPGARNAVESLPAHPAAREGHRRSPTRHAWRSPPRWSRELETVRRSVQRVRAGRAGAAAAGEACRRQILDDMETSEVSIFAVKAQRNELRTRMQMTDVVNRRKMRHAHMVNIDRRIMLEGMRADFAQGGSDQPEGLDMVRKAARDPRDHTRPAPTSGRDSDPNYKWLKTSGIISPRQVGQPARRRNLHHARRGERDIRDRRRGGRLPVREVRRPEANSADDRGGENRLVSARQRQQGT